MVLHGHHEAFSNIVLAVLLIGMLVFQAIVPSRTVKAADTSSVWHLVSQKARNISYTEAATDGKTVINVGTRGAVVLTSDLVHWEPSEQFTSKDLYGICWGNSMYVAVGDEGTLFTSTDGRAWTGRAVPGDPSLASIAFGNGSYVAVGVGGAIVRSSDGAEWETVAATVDKNLYDVTFGGGRFVVVGQDGTIVTSTDGLMWEDRTVSSETDLYAVAWGKDKYVTAGGASAILSSPDGAVWTQQTAAFEDLTFAAVTYAGGAFVLAANHDSMRESELVPTRWAVFYFRSVDGMSWQKMTWQETYVWKRSSWVRGMLWTGSQLVSFGDNGSAQTSPDGLRWTNRTSAGNAVIVGIANGEGMYVGVGTEDAFNGAVYSSLDGLTWQHEVNPQIPRANENYEQWQDDLYGVAYGNGVFVAVGSYGVILRSIDGHAWTVEESGTRDSLLAIARIGDTFAAVGNNGTLLTSLDGHVWTPRLPSRKNLLFWSMAVGRDTVVVMGADIGRKGSRTVITSVPVSDLRGTAMITVGSLTPIGEASGKTWLAQVAYGNNRFVAVADANGSSWYSDDGVKWQAAAPAFVYPIHAITFAQGTFVAVGYGRTIATSPDGVSWTVQSGDSASLGHEDYICAFGDTTRFMVTSLMSSTVMSLDGIKWAGTGDNDNEDATLTAVADTPKGLVVVGELGCVRTSRDGMVWQRSATDASGWIMDVAVTSSGAVAVGEFGLVMTSPDLVSWSVLEPVTSETLTGVAAGGEHLVAVGDNHVVVTSEDGQSWKAADSGLDFDLSSVAFGAGVFVAVGQNGAIAISSDGHLWERVVTGLTADLNDVAWLGGTFAVVGGGGAILTSDDGMTWSPQKSGTAAALLAVTSQGSLLVAVGDKGTTAISSDGARWMVIPSPTKEILYGCAARGGRFVAVGSSDTTMWTSDLVAPVSPIPTRPISGSSVDAGSTTLVWSAVPGMVSYDVQTSTTADFTRLILDRHELSATSAVLGAGDLSASGMTYWRVRSVGTALVSAWSTVQSFTVRAVVPPAHQRILVLHVASTEMSVDGVSTTIDVAPQIVEGRTLLPIKWVAEPLGAVVSWNATDRKVTITLKGTTLELWIGRSQARVNGVAVPIDSTNARVVPLIVSGRTMLPVRFVAEQLGADVQWEQSTKTITITYQQP
ncbi:MAG: stalk domain-containing protein [Candidatus Cryosericum sp.]